MPRTARRATPRTTLAGLLSLSLVLGTWVLTAPAQAAAPAAPTDLEVASGQRAPSFSWAHVLRATDYQLQVDDDDDFSSPLPVNGTATQVTTKNNTFVPLTRLPLTTAQKPTLYWRVRAATGSEWSEWTTGPGLDTAGTAEAPTLLNPGPQVTFTAPETPLLSWKPAPGAASYIVAVAGSSEFIDATTYTTKSTSVALPASPGIGRRWWRVRAVYGSNIQSEWSLTGSFMMAQLPTPTLISPPDDTNHELQDVVLDWDPVPGASSYDLQVARNTDFTTLVVDKQKLLSSRFSPNATIGNGQYFWRVAARDMNDNLMPWSPTRSGFHRTWPQVPTLVHPVAPGVEDVPGPMYFQWEPVPHATEYELEVGSDENFSPGTFDACRVAGTTYTPGNFAVNHNTGTYQTARPHEKCRVPAGRTMYWRVKGIDRPSDIPGMYSETQAFRYEPLSITGFSPANNADVTTGIPTLSWQPVVGAQSYSVRVYANDGSEVSSATTRATSYTPSGDRPLRLTDSPFTWTVQATTAALEKSLTFSNTFTLSGTPPSTGAPALTPLTPTQSTPGITEAPRLTWEPVANAAYYQVRVGDASDGIQVWWGNRAGSLFNQPIAYPTMTDTSAHLMNPGTYDWQVQAFSSSGALLETGPEGRFTVQPIAAVTGHAVALNGQAADPNHPSGAGTPCSESTGVCQTPSTPVLTWTPDPRVSFYMVYVSTNADFSGTLETLTNTAATTGSMYFPTLANTYQTYPDSEAGKAFHWFVRPCRNEFNCGPSPVGVAGTAHHTFEKRSLAVANPTTTALGDGEVTFSWDNYLATNHAYVWPQTGERAAQEAMQYNVQVSTSESFVPSTQTLVDQTTFTSPDTLYQQGQELYWRVQAVDSKGNKLAWSAPQTFSAQSSAVAQNPLGTAGPSGTVTTSGSPTFTWQPVPFNGSYNVEVYSGTTRVHSAIDLRGTSWVPTVPLAPGEYTWRVQALNSSRKAGPWSAPNAANAAFTVAPGNVVLTSPINGAPASPVGPVLTWDATQTPQAATFRVNFAPAGSTSGGTTVTTSATSWAVPAAVAAGTYRWTVTPLDTNGVALSETQSTFTVDNSLTADEEPLIRAPGGSAVGATLEVEDPAWNRPLVTNSYEWLRNGIRISGAIGTSYTLVAADYDRQITVRVTGTRHGFSQGVTTSAAVVPGAGGGLVPSVMPWLSGTPIVSKPLILNLGTWLPQQPSSVTRVWLRDGVPINGPTGSSYTLTSHDADTEISVRLTAQLTGYQPVTVETEPVRVETLAALERPSIDAPDGARVGTSVAAIDPTWNQTDVTMTYQWRRAGIPIRDATSATYRIVAADRDKELTVAVTGNKASYPQATSVSEPVTVQSGAAAENTAAPSLSGGTKVGEIVTASPGQWSPSATSFVYQWLRNGEPIGALSRSTYALSAMDAGQSISVRVHAQVPGLEDGVATSAAVVIAKLRSSTTVTLPLTTVKASKKAKVTFTVAVPGIPAPGGTVTILDGKRVVKTVTLKAGARGTMTVTLPKLKKGTHTLKARYGGDSRATASTSKVARLKVV